MSNKHRRTGQSPMFIIGVGALLMVLLEFVVFPDRKPVPLDMTEPPQRQEQTVAIVESSSAPEQQIVEPFDKPADPPPAMMEAYGPVLDFEEPQAMHETAVIPAYASDNDLWRKNAVAPPPVPPGAARVVIIIDDLGVDKKRSEQIMALPGPLTAAFLPYARNVAPMADAARAQGHEIMIHMPMEPTDPDLDMGSIALRAGMDGAAFDATLDKALAAFGHYVGMNNHMGSRLTQDRDAMNRLMNRLAREGMLFVDSRTIGHSVAERTAALHGVPHAGRDIFLDHTPTYEGVVERLAALEAVAKRNGVAIAIGHPKDGTIKALAEWLPTLKEKNIVLVPVSAVVKTDPLLRTVSADIPVDEDAAAETVPAPQMETPAIILPAPDEWMVVHENMGE